MTPDGRIHTAQTVRVAAVGDLHCRATSAGAYVSLFTAMNAAADVAVLAGDLTDLGQFVPVPTMATRRTGSCEFMRLLLGWMENVGVASLSANPRPRLSRQSPARR